MHPDVWARLDPLYLDLRRATNALDRALIETASEQMMPVADIRYSLELRHKRRASDKPDRVMGDE